MYNNLKERIKFIVMIFIFIAILFVSGTDYEDVKNFMDKED